MTEPEHSRQIDPTPPKQGDADGTAPIDIIDTAILRDGVPYAPRYGDTCHSHAGDLGQAQHVFLQGNRLTQRWEGQDQFVIVETGFGLGLNFLATWAAWRDAPRRPRRLHFVSIEKHPFSAAALAAALTASGMHAQPALSVLASELVERWPVPTPGLHRLRFAGGAVTLTLALGDMLRLLPRLAVGADAFYLDGFAPSRNPDMWSPQVFRGLARLARTGATLATYTAAGFVRRGLQDAGFEVEKAPGFGGKRDMTVARFAPRWSVRRHAPAEAVRWPQRHALVIGAGLAGCPVAAQLGERGWRVTLLDRQAGPARETSAHHAAILHPHLSPDDNLLARATRAGFWSTLSRWRELTDRKHSLTRGNPKGNAADTSPRSSSGMLERAADAAEATARRAMLEALRLPAAYARWLDAEEAQARSGVPCPFGGIWFESGDWIAPPGWCAAELAHQAEAIDWRAGTGVAALRREDGLWQACAADGRVLAQAPVVVLANALDAPRLLRTIDPALNDCGALDALAPLRAVRGQLSRVPAGWLRALPRSVVCGDGYLLPPLEGRIQVGASYAENDADTRLRPADHRENLERLQRLTGQPVTATDAAIDALDGFAAPRCVAPDRLPLLGSVPDMSAIRALMSTNAAKLAGAHLRDLPRIPGLYLATGYGSRGVTWAALGADCIASALEGEPMPLENDLLAALDPARFVLRELRAGRLPGRPAFEGEGQKKR